jgi:hypothetical protein
MSMNTIDSKITILQAYKAMILFLEKEYELTKSNDLGGLLGGYQLQTDEKDTIDSAAWNDWILSVNKAIFNDLSKIK